MSREFAVDFLSTSRQKMLGGGSAEDDGLLSVPRLDALRGRTNLVLYDARTLEEVGWGGDEGGSFC